MFDFLNYSIHGWTVGSIIMALGVIAYVVFLFRIARPGSLRLSRGGEDGLRGSLRITRGKGEKKD